MVATAQSELEALIALVDKSRDRGNRDRRLSELAENLAERAIEERFNIAAKPPKSVAYLHYVTLCEGAKDTNGQPVLPMSYPTFCKRCDQYESVKSREGKRAAYQKSAIHQSLNNAYPVNGTRPHEICYMDHTVATISTQDIDGAPLGKPTLSAAIDGYSRNARAFILTYDPPSTRTVLLLLRDYVRRHGRLPRVIVVDNGKEFHSHELEHFCKVYGGQRGALGSHSRGGDLPIRLAIRNLDGAEAPRLRNRLGRFARACLPSLYPARPGARTAPVRTSPVASGCGQVLPRAPQRARSYTVQSSVRPAAWTCNVSQPEAWPVPAMWLCRI
jgi:transposase InsO family protein